MKFENNRANREEARELYYNKQLSTKELAYHYGKSERTIYRWINVLDSNNSYDRNTLKKKRERPRKYPLEIFNRIMELKIELPMRTAPIIRRTIRKEFSSNTPSLSTIYKYLHQQGLNIKTKIQRKGYVQFE